MSQHEQLGIKLPDGRQVHAHRQGKKLVVDNAVKGLQVILEPPVSGGQVAEMDAGDWIDVGIKVWGLIKGGGGGGGGGGVKCTQTITSTTKPDGTITTTITTTCGPA